MGQVYDISLQFNGEPDEDEIVKKTIEYIANTKDHVRYSESDLQLSEQSTLLDALDVIFTDNIGCGYYGPEGSRNLDTIPGRLTAGFDATYGWQEIMENWFEYVAPAMGEGTWLHIWPDSGVTKAVVKNGKAEFSYHYR